jgi:hypothetical protein
MSKEAAISRLAEDYKLVRIQGAGDEWLVQSKSAPIVDYGHLGFHNGKLTYAAKNWTQGDEDTYAFGQALHGAIDEFVKEGRHQCYIDTATTRSPDADMRSILLTCRAKKLTIRSTQVLSGVGKGQYTEINEVLSSEEYR